MEFPAVAVSIGTMAERGIELIVDPGLAWRKHTDDNIGSVIEAKSLAENAWIAPETSFPKFVAENEDRIPETIAVIVVGKIPAENGGYSKSAEEASRDLAGDDFFGGAESGEVGFAIVIGSDFDEGMIGGADVPEIGFGE